MGGGLMQLVAYGAQDIYLTGNPQITFFKVVYRRHTNFSMEEIQQTWNGNANATKGRCTAVISRNGDLVHRMYIQVLGAGNSGDNPGANTITDVTLEIGGQKIDKHSGDWMEAWAELTEPNPTGGVNTTLFQFMSGMGGDHPSSGENRYYIPLQFWFCRNPGLALPLIALQYHEVKVILNHKLREAFSHHQSFQHLWCDYIYLDTDERRRFAQVSHEYLIEQVQEQSWTENNSELNFNHPVKELVWRTKGANIEGGSTPVTGSWLLKLNGHERFAARNANYFTRTQVWEHHSGAGGLNMDGALGETQGRFDDSIAVYSFALKPEEHQPSGTCNFSRIDNAELEYIPPTPNENSGVTVVYAVNYNVLRIMSGMGGLAYSN